MNDHALERLAERLDELEERVSVLEHPPAARKPDSSPHAEIMPEPQVAATAPATQSGNMFPVMGRAMLGIAGAYLLRAVAESGAVPRIAVVAAGIAYAFLWLVWAGLAREGPRLKSSIYACTSALILAPMLWELTLDFHLLPVSVTAGVLCAYAAAALALGWKRDIAPVLRVSLDRRGGAFARSGDRLACFASVYRRVAGAGRVERFCPGSRSHAGYSLVGRAGCRCGDLDPDLCLFQPAERAP